MALPKRLEAWARKVDQAEREWARREVDSWARTAAFPQPFRWGEAEAMVLARDYPPLPGSAAARAVGVVGWAAVAVLAVPLAGAALIGLALVAIGRTGADADAWFSLANGAFTVAAIVAFALLSIWWETRRRSTTLLVLNGVNAAASAAAFLVLAAAEAPADAWLPVLVLAAAVLNALSFGLGLVSKPEGRPKRRKPPRRGPRGDRRARAVRARKRLLEVVVHRGLVDLDEADRIRVGEMPLGYWSELDGLDEREWRRVLERRHVGWRDFDSRN